MPKLIYFAGPLFSQAEREFNLKLATDLESIGFDVFLPQRDGVESSKEPYKSMSKDDRRRCMFELVGLHTDSRAAFIGAKLNPMLDIPLEFIAETYSELTYYLQ